MPNESKKIMCPDPDCNTENDAAAENCTKCNLNLPAFFTMNQVSSVREKIAKKAAADAQAKKDADKPKRSGLASLMGGK